MRDSGMRDIIVIAGVLFAIFMAGFFFWSNSSLGDNSQETATSASSSKQETAAPVSCTTLDEDDGDGFDECKAKLKDGRTVTCLARRGGLSCDWAHAKTGKEK